MRRQVVFCKKIVEVKDNVIQVEFIAKEVAGFKQTVGVEYHSRVDIY